MRRALDRFGDLIDRVRSSLFYVPAVFILGAFLLARVTTRLDAAIASNGAPALLESLMIQSTSQGARTLLGTIAGATITVAGIVFSVTMLSVQLASSQFSPRVLEGFLRDRFKQNVMGFVVGTFTYCLLVLAVLRAQVPGAEAETAQRRLSVTVAVALGVLSVLAIVAFIDQSARSMQVGQIIRRIADDTMERIVALHPRPGDGKAPIVERPMPEGHGWTVRAVRDGWVQRVDEPSLLKTVPPGGVIRLDTRVGAFVGRQLPLATMWPKPADPEATASAVRDAVIQGRTRTLRQDVAFGFRQLVDIALRALSPGINDPTTANETLVHLSGLVREIMIRDQPPRVVGDERECRIYRPHDFDRGDYVQAAFSEIRRAAADQPAVLATLLRVLVGLKEILVASDLEERLGPLEAEARSVVGALAASHLLGEDIEPLHELAGRLIDLDGEG